MKALIIFVLFVLQSIACFGIDKNTNSKTRNIIELGESVVSLFNGHGFQPTLNVNYSYTRFITLYSFIKADYYKYDVTYTDIDNIRTGDVLSTRFRTVRLCYGKEFLINRFRFSPYLCINYRWGKGEEFVAFFDPQFSFEMKVDENPMRSWGSGIGTKIDYVIKKRFSVGLELNYSLNNEKFHPINYPNNTNPGIERFKPNKTYSTIQLKFGYHF